MDGRAEIERIIARRDIRSSDKANMRRMLEQIKHGEPLSSQERLNLWSYIKRYDPAFKG